MRVGGSKNAVISERFSKKKKKLETRWKIIANILFGLQNWIFNTVSVISMKQK